VRRVFGVLLLICLGLADVRPVQARERVVMPFDCGLESGHLKLSPTVPKSYPIIGTREEESVTTCRPPLADGCRTLMVHRFVISCGGVGVAWMRVVAAIGRTNGGRAWVDDGHLNITLPPRSTRGPGASCFDGPPADGRNRLERRVVFMQECLPWRRRFREVIDHVVLPEGFAPLGEFGARLQLVSADAGYSLDEARLDAGLDDAVLVPGRGNLLSRSGPDATATPAGTVYGSPRGAITADDWVTEVRAERDYGSALPPAKTAGFSPAWTLFLATLGVVTAAGAIRLRGLRLKPARVFSPVPRAAPAFRRNAWRTDRATTFSADDLTSAGAAVAAFFVQTEAAVAQLKEAGPLRDVLQSEMKHLRERLRTVEAGARDGVPAANTGPHYRALVRELERIRRIAESAAASLTGARQASSLPRTMSEAYDVLGVNADVSEDVLKKIVDALRMSWHPDHARDEQDRMAREERIRQINVAWDIITSKREAA
jgi:hypothetical protein